MTRHSLGDHDRLCRDGKKIKAKVKALLGQDPTNIEPELLEERKGNRIKFAEKPMLLRLLDAWLVTVTAANE